MLNILLNSIYSIWIQMISIRKYYIHYILILLFSASLYLNSLYADFTYDDNRAILENQDLLPSTPWYHLLINDYWGTPIRSSNSHGSYRPITVASFRLNHMIHGQTPFGFHLVNLILHLIVTLLYIRLVERILNGKRKRITLIASILFASHPIHVESVTSIVGRADVVAALFYLMALFFYVKFVESRIKRKYLLLTIISATMSMLAKEHGITCLPVCLVYHLFIIHRFFPFTKNNWTNILKRQEYYHLRVGLKDISIALILLLTFRLSLIRYRPSFSSADNPISDHQSVIVRFLTFHYLPVFNFWLLIYPRWLSFDWSMDAIPLIVSWFDIKNLFTSIFYVIIFIFAKKICNYYSLVSKSKVKINGNHQNIKKNISTMEQCHRCRHHNNYHQQHRFPSIIIDENNNNDSMPNLNNNNQPIIDLNNNDDGLVGNYPILISNNNNNNLPSIKHVTSNSSRMFNTQKSLKKINHYQQTKLTEIDCFALSLALMIIPFLPATNLFFYIGFVVAERILYIPSFGFCLFLATCIEKFIQYCRFRLQPLKYLIYSGYFVLIISFSIRTILRNVDWLTEENLYRSGIPINPPKAYGNLANILSTQPGKQIEAEETYRKALDYRFNMADVHYNLGLLLQNQTRYQEALECYQQAIRFRPRLAMAYLNMASIHSRLGDKQRAKQIYEKCSTLDSYGLKDIKNHEITRISALYNLGRLYLEEEDYHSALKIYQKALFQMPSYYPAHSLFNTIGEVYYKLNRTKEAETWFMKSLKIKHDHIPAYLTYAKMMIKLNKTFEAEQLYKKALKISPNDTTIYHHYGQFILNMNGQLSKALDIYQKAFRLFPNDCDIVINLANILREMGKNIDAERYYIMAAELRPNDVITHSNLGAIYHLNGKFDLAKRTYQRALELKPDDNITQINMAKLNRALNKNKPV